ncbi:GPW/gp25 family protein [Citrobacter sp. FP75]|uniref:GPW/gp25 family protein n=1 Tax=Citrobacter sp. FP75 TaxID=1852949 RepID=UPI001BC9773B|nr:GPW/gp25 family protein [Citrobacter sp. FP75]
MGQPSIPVALFDRLLDEDISPRESVRRELMRLFNSRAPAGAEELPLLLAWGVPEWHGFNAGDERALGGYCRQLRAAILRHEPRIQALSVSVRDVHQQTLALHLDVVLREDDEPLTLELTYLHGSWQ